MEKFLIIKDFTRKNRKFGLHGRTLEFKINTIPHDAEPVKWIKNAIEGIIAKGTEGLLPSDQVGFTFCSKDFARGEGWMRFRHAFEVNVDDIWEKISSIYQSNSTGLNTDTFCLGVTTVRIPRGKGRGRDYNNFDMNCAKKRGIVTINNKDNLCLPRALVVAIALNDKDPEYKEIRSDTGKKQVQEALKLLKECKVTIPEEGAGIPELQQFQNYLNAYKITVYSYGNKGRDVIFEGNSSGSSLNLLYHKGHYNVITSLTAAFCCSYYCEECHVPYNQKSSHKCRRTCPGCQQTPPCSNGEPSINCNSCKRSFRGQVCFNNHEQYRICSQIRRCEECFKVVPTSRPHICGEIFCKICNKHCPTDHLCYIQPDSKTPPSKDFLFICYDLETRQETIHQESAVIHEPNLCVFNQRCFKCIQEKQLCFCQSCGFRQKILKDGDVISTFLKHVLEIRKKFKSVIVLAHNGGGFDHQFILNYILTKTDINPDLIMRGSKLISMTVGNVKFLDTLNYFPMALSKFPKAFGFSELKKGYFPHLYNTLKNQKYIGPIPNIEFYDPDNLKTEERDNLLKWHSERVAEDYIFKFEKELIEYCVSDVEILTEACLKFREMMLKETNVCPFLEATTIASACNKVYRRNFLEPHTIGIIPKRGYRWSHNQSKIAIQWLVWEERERNIDIQHAAKGDEIRVAGVKVDGYNDDTKQVFEFQGCYYHGCPRCFKHQRDVPLKEDPSVTLHNRYEATIAKNERIRNLGYNIVEKWECDFRHQMATNREIVDYTENHPFIIQTPLEARDAFYGGRTGNTKSYYKIQANEKIKYVDVCSLYPFVCKYGKFPIGHPTVHVGDECTKIDLLNTSGLVKCKVLPPRDLYHPVLPQKMNKKLMFVLCRECGKTNNSGDCLHSEEERSITGTWVIDEVVTAIENGYELKETFEIWAYQTVQFGKKQQGLFTSMMNTFIKIKQESSDWPPNCQTESEKNNYIDRFLQREDILLEFSKIDDNPGLRQLAKLMLNSFWGKFGQRENQPKTSIVNNPADFFKMLSNPSIYINTVLPVNENTLIVN